MQLPCARSHSNASKFVGCSVLYTVFGGEKRERRERERARARARVREGTREEKKEEKEREKER